MACAAERGHKEATPNYAYYNSEVMASYMKVTPSHDYYGSDESELMANYGIFDQEACNNSNTHGNISDGQDQNLSIQLTAGEAMSIVRLLLFGFMILIPGLYVLNKEKSTTRFVWSFLQSFMGIFIAFLAITPMNLLWEALRAEEIFGRSPIMIDLALYTAVVFVCYILCGHSHLSPAVAVGKHFLSFYSVRFGGIVLFRSERAMQHTLAFVLIGWMVQLLASWVAKQIGQTGGVREEEDEVRRRCMEARFDEALSELVSDASGIRIAVMVYSLGAMQLFPDMRTSIETGIDEFSMYHLALFHPLDRTCFAMGCAVLSFIFLLFLMLALEEEVQTGVAMFETHTTVLVKCRLRESDPSRPVILWRLALVFSYQEASTTDDDFQPLRLLEDADNWEIQKDNKGLPSCRRVHGNSLKQLLRLFEAFFRFSASWCLLLSAMYLLRGLMMPMLLNKNLEGNITVCLILCLFTGLFILLLSTNHNARCWPRTLMKYTRIHMMTTMSYTTALAWDSVFDLAFEDVLPKDETWQPVGLVSLLLFLCFLWYVFAEHMWETMEMSVKELEQEEEDESEELLVELHN